METTVLLFTGIVLLVLSYILGSGLRKGWEEVRISDYHKIKIRGNSNGFSDYIQTKWEES